MEKVVWSVISIKNKESQSQNRRKKELNYD